MKIVPVLAQAWEFIRQGDSIPSIAKSNGLLWKQIWEHADNAELKKLRKDPNVLCAGDVVMFLMNKESMTFGQALEYLERFEFTHELYGTS